MIPVNDPYQNFTPRLRKLADEVAELLDKAKPDSQYYQKFIDSLMHRYRPDIVAERQTVETFFEAVKERREEIAMRRALGLL
jgi:hypothetical protein